MGQAQNIGHTVVEDRCSGHRADPRKACGELRAPQLGSSSEAFYNAVIAPEWTAIDRATIAQTTHMPITPAELREGEK